MVVLSLIPWSGGLRKTETVPAWNAQSNQPIGHLVAVPKEVFSPGQFGSPWFEPHQEHTQIYVAHFQCCWCCSRWFAKNKKLMESTVIEPGLLAWDVNALTITTCLCGKHWRIWSYIGQHVFAGPGLIAMLTDMNVLSAYSLHYCWITSLKEKKPDMWCILMTETVTVSNVIAIASLVSAIWLAMYYCWITSLKVKKQTDMWCILTTETVTMSNVIAIASLVPEIWLATYSCIIAELLHSR